MKVLVTAGPTIEKIDPVRYISNFSSGKQGYAIAEELKNSGFDVTLISGPTNLNPIEKVRLINVESARDMLDATLNNLPADIAIFTAAVCDWRIENFSDSKLKKTKDIHSINLNLVKNPDILEIVSNHEFLRPKLVIGFCLETDNLIENARLKLKNKNCDYIIANMISPDNKIFNNDENEVYFITKDGEEFWYKQSKIDIAKKLISKFSQVNFEILQLE